MRLELEHRLLDASIQVASPNNVAGNRRGIANERWIMLVSLIRLLHLLQLLTILMKDERVLVVQAFLRAIAM